jgi:hypothetical protein
MLKKHLIITLLISAYTVVLGHSIIPHHHHDDNVETEQSPAHEHDNDHHDHEGDHQDEEDSDSAHGFENYFHSAETGDFHQLSVTKISFNTITTAYIIALFDFKIKAFESPPPIVRHPNNHIPLIRHSLSPKGLRAPPCSLA